MCPKKKEKKKEETQFPHTYAYLYIELLLIYLASLKYNLGWNFLYSRCLFCTIKKDSNKMLFCKINIQQQQQQQTTKMFVSMPLS